MHEASLVDALFDEVARHVPPTAVLRRVRVRLGDAAGVDPELFALAFAVARDDRGCPDAELDLVEEATAWVCGGCGGALGELGPCPACGAPARRAAGGGIVLERLELDDV